MGLKLGAGRLIAGRYLLLDRLGRGGMGTVWRARDRVLEREVAVKELHIFTDGGEEHGRLLRRIDGPSLVRLLADHGPLPPRRAAVLGLQMLGALEAVHAAGALHRDVKPANVLLRRDGSAVLTDFGIAILDDGEFLTSTGELVGSADFMAPERLNGDAVGPASDLWSLGATLCVISSGESPFGRTSRVATLHAVAFGEPMIPERVGPPRPVLEALLRKAPEQRPSAAMVRDALRRVADGATDPGPLPLYAGRHRTYGLCRPRRPCCPRRLTPYGRRTSSRTRRPGRMRAIRPPGRAVGSRPPSAPAPCPSVAMTAATTIADGAGNGRGGRWRRPELGLRPELQGEPRSINDDCLDDNKGTLNVTVSVTH
ncbi:serine/threonine-protein kinase [Streptomyces sp. NPDC059679]|uniref:serine/threonine-protein kinase n=1 Tax=Streptomyces sp. NPDC059679 TaxID=3346903 RepID=UPI0036CBBEE0